MKSRVCSRLLTAVAMAYSIYDKSSRAIRLQGRGWHLPGNVGRFMATLKRFEKLRSHTHVCRLSLNQYFIGGHLKDGKASSGGSHGIDDCVKRLQRVKVLIHGSLHLVPSRGGLAQGSD